MNDGISDSQPDWARLLPREVFQEVVRCLRAALPRPVPDTPADRARRDRAAVAAVAGLLPVTAAESRLAAQFVVTDAWATDCLRLADEKWREPDLVRQYQSQAMRLLREGRSSLRLLATLQARRAAVAQDAEAANRAEWVEHAALTMMGEALGTGEALEPVAEPGCGEEAVAGGERRFVSADETKSRGTRRETDPRPLGCERVERGGRVSVAAVGAVSG